MGVHSSIQERQGLGCGVLLWWCCVGEGEGGEGGRGLTQPSSALERGLTRVRAETARYLVTD